MGLFDVLLRPLRSPIVTRQYRRTPTPDRGHRGTPELEPGRCRVSGDCAVACPNGASSSGTGAARRSGT
jgi:formate hydrogenlyase subunit 6/NADH:ubiquinone oxidoreductase subunit I